MLTSAVYFSILYEGTMQRGWPMMLISASAASKNCWLAFVLRTILYVCWKAISVHCKKY